MLIDHAVLNSDKKRRRLKSSTHSDIDEPDERKCGRKKREETRTADEHQSQCTGKKSVNNMRYRLVHRFCVFMIG